MATDWQIDGAAGQPIRVSTDACEGKPRMSVVLAHGFKGYKEYGFIPVMGRELASRVSVIVHRFNFSHAGMGEDISTFEYPELFERNTLNYEVHDLGCVVDAVRERDGDLPVVCMGHSRGGVSTILAAGRAESQLRPAAVVTLASPDRSFWLSDRDKQILLDKGFVDSPSSRTGQNLRLGRAWLEEQLTQPGEHDVLACAGRLDMPVLVVHGDQDPTVPVSCAHAIAHNVTRCELRVIPGGNHVFNMPNPADDAPNSVAFSQVLDAVCDFMTEQTAG
jgi:uncharacterized protein